MADGAGRRNRRVALPFALNTLPGLTEATTEARPGRATRSGTSAGKPQQAAASTKETTVKITIKIEGVETPADAKKQAWELAINACFRLAEIDTVKVVPSKDGFTASITGTPKKFDDSAI